jgi:iduronate 2-sulfatase
MTGLRPSTTGIYGMIDDNKIKEDNEVTRDIIFLPEYFKNQGYHTMGTGKLFHQHAPDGVFDESAGSGGFGPKPEKRFKWEGKVDGNYSGTGTDWGAYPVKDSFMPDFQSAVWANERLHRKYDKPFFLAVGFLRPHVPWYVPQEWFDQYDVAELDLPPHKADDLNDVPKKALEINDLPMMPSTEWAIKSGEWPNIVKAYLACVTFVDEQVGKLLTALDESSYANNTIIILWSDHGYRLGEKGTFAKHALWEEATHTPLIFAGPGVPSGKVNTQPVELLSIYPTLLDLCGLPAYKRNEGKSLVPFLRGDEPKQEQYAITTYGRNNHAVRTKDFRYIRYEDGSEELYDHRKDPNEWENIAGDKTYRKTIMRLKKYLPDVNVHWTKHSQYNFQPYFREQKERSEAALKE